VLFVKIAIAVLLAVLILWGALLLAISIRSGWPDIVYVRVPTKTFYFKPHIFFAIWTKCTLELIVVLYQLWR